MTTSYWCELAWLGGDTRRRPASSIDVDGDRITAVHAGVAEPPPTARRASRASRCRAWPTPTATRSTGCCAARTQSGVGSFWTWREQMYAAAERLTPRAYHRLARRCSARWRWPASPASASSTTSTTTPDGVPYDDPNAMGAALVAAAADGRHPDHAARHVLPARRHRRRAAIRGRSGGSATATRSAWASARVGARPADVGDGPRSAPRSTPCGRSIRRRPRSSRRGRAERDVPLHCHVSEQPAENEQCLAAYGRTPDGAARPTRAARRALHRRPRHPPHRRPTSPRSAPAGRPCACARRPSATSPTASARRRRCATPESALALGSDSHAVIDLFEEARAVELDERLATCVRGNHDAPSLLARGDRATATAASAGRRAGGSRSGALADLVHGAPRLGAAGRRPPRARCSTSVVFAATAADVDHVVVGGERDRPRRRARAIDVAAELRRDRALEAV